MEDQTVKFELELNRPDLLDKLVWLKNGQEIKLDNPELYEAKAIGAKYSLVIKKAAFDDEGEYKVRVRDSPLESTANLSVEEAPLEFVKPLHDIEVKEAQTARFECELNKPGEKVKWYRGDKKLEPDNKNVFIESDGKVHTLVLKNVNADDAAKYYAKTSGPSTSANLYVEGKLKIISILGIGFFNLKKKKQKQKNFYSKC